MLDLIFQNRLYPTGLEFKRVDGYPNTNEGCILIIPGRYWWEHFLEINAAVRRYKWLLAIRTGDEEDLFDINRIEHPNCHWWVQTPCKGRDYGDARLFGVGYPPHFNHLKPCDRVADVFLAAQNTHTRRNQCFNQLVTLHARKHVEETTGFTQGMGVQEYARMMCSTKVAPAPSGAFSPDSFRLYEALEAHAVPIADTISPVYNSKGYWHMLFPPEAPFPTISDYNDLPGYIDDQLRLWPMNTNRITAWWMRYKRSMSRWVKEDLQKMGAL